MTVEHLIDNYMYVGDYISVMSCVILLVIISKVLYYSKDYKFTLLKWAVHLIMVGSFVNIVFGHFCSVGCNNSFIIFGLRDIYHICFMTSMYLFIWYLANMLNVRKKSFDRMMNGTRVVYVILVIMDVLSPVTGFGFHREDNLWYDSIISPYNIFYVYAILSLLYMLFFHSDRMIKAIRDCLVMTVVVDMVAMAHGCYFNCNTFTSFTYVTPIVVVMVLLHSKPFDDKTGALGGDSFDSYVRENAKKGRSIDYMVLQLRKKNNSNIPDELGKILNSFWHSTFRDATLFHIDTATYVLAVPRIDGNGDTEQKIRQLCDNDFQRYYAKYQMQYKVLGLFDIDFITDEADLKAIISYLFITRDENTVTMTDAKLKEELKLIRAVRENLADIEEKGDLDDPRVLVYCQPIRNMKTGGFDTAEALMRMSIPEKDFVTPNIFIPLAEYYGNIHALSMIMLNKVCKEAKRLEYEGYQFKRISVNFTASEIRGDSFCDEVLDIIRSNNLNPSKIGVELTETQNERDFNIIKEKIAVLKATGMTFYLDDIGTGYSNLDRIVKYDVDVVKFDRFFLLEAEKDEKVIHMMKHLSEAFKDLNYKLLFEGVETEENETLCLDCDADYIQGFKYSKPLPAAQLRDFFVK